LIIEYRKKKKIRVKSKFFGEIRKNNEIRIDLFENKKKKINLMFFGQIREFARHNKRFKYNPG